MTLSSGRGHLVRALLEGIAAQVATLTSLVADDLGRPLTRLRVDGGLTRSRTLMQAQADLAQMPVEVYPSAHATPLGAAACARLALDPGRVGGRRRRRLGARRGLRADLVGRPRRGAPGSLARSGRRRPVASAARGDERRRRGRRRHRRRHRRLRDRAGAGRLPASSVVLVEARDDVGDGTSKANTAILHTGFDAKPGTLESRLVARGYHLLGEYAARTGIPVERTGALLVAWTDEELAALPGLKEKAEANGYDACRLVDADEVYAAVPDLGAGALGGLTVPDESIICTWTTNLALATDAVRRGAAAAARPPGRGGPAARRPGRADGPGHRPGRDRGPVGGQRGRPRCRRRRPDVRPRPVHRHPAPRRARRVRQARAARWCPRSCCRCRRRVARACSSARPIYGNVMLGPTAEDLDGPHRDRHVRAGLRLPAGEGSTG